jgi:hypothetical protein
VFAKANADFIRVAESDTLLEAVVPDGASSTAYCLHLKAASYRSPKGVAPTLATLYRVRDASDAHAIESRTPLFSELVLGALAPDEVRLAAQDGWLAFRSTGRRWRAVPWGLVAWRELARGVFDADHRPVFEGMFSLIIGDEQVPDVAASVARRPVRFLPVKSFVDMP